MRKNFTLYFNPITRVMQTRKNKLNMVCLLILFSSLNIISLHAAATWDNVEVDANASCNGGCDGVIMFDANHNATGDFNVEYTYNGTVYSIGPYNTLGANYLSNLCVGTYSDFTIVAINDGSRAVWPNDMVIYGEAMWDHVTHNSNESVSGACDGSFVIDPNLNSTGEFTVSYILNGNTTVVGPFNDPSDTYITGLCAGTYSNITITGVNTGCTAVWPNSIVITGGNAPVSHTISIPVATGSDDAEESSNGSMSVTSSDLELVYDGSNQKVGMRFQNVTIPQGATIESAYVEFNVDEVNIGSTDLTFYGEDIDNSPTYLNIVGNISSRTKTTASVDWDNVPSWLITNTKQQSPDLSSIIQEIVDRNGWVEGYSLSIIVNGTGERTADS